MATNNVLNTGITPLAISQGGTGASSMATTDSIVYYDGTKLASASTGFSGMALTSNGAGVAPTFQGSSLMLLKTQTASSSSSLVFNSTFITSAYKIYFVQIQQLVPTTNGVTFNMDWSTNNGVSYLNSNYQCGTNVNTFSGATQFNDNTTTTARVTRVATVLATIGFNGFLYIYNLAVSSNSQPMYIGETYMANGLNHCFGWNSGNPNINAIKFSMSSNTIASGNISLYGVLQ